MMHIARVHHAGYSMVDEDPWTVQVETGDPDLGCPTWKLQVSNAWHDGNEKKWTTVALPCIIDCT